MSKLTCQVTSNTGVYQVNIDSGVHWLVKIRSLFQVYVFLNVVPER